MFVKISCCPLLFFKLILCRFLLFMSLLEYPVIIILRFENLVAIALTKVSKTQWIPITPISENFLSAAET